MSKMWTYLFWQEQETVFQIVTLRVYPHVKQFILSKYGLEPIQITEGSFEKQIIACRLRSKVYNNTEFRGSSQSKITSTTITNSNFESFYEDFFCNEMVCHIESVKRNSIKVLPEIYDFFQMHEIDEKCIDSNSCPRYCIRRDKRKGVMTKTVTLCSSPFQKTNL